MYLNVNAIVTFACVIFGVVSLVASKTGTYSNLFPFFFSHIYFPHSRLWNIKL